MRLFGYSHGERLHFIAAPTLDLPETVHAITTAIAANEKVLLYFQEKLGGEISLAKTDASPSFAFDWTLVEITHCDPDLAFGRFGIVEVQTMDFHGSYKHAVLPTTERLISDPETFHAWAASPTGQATLSRQMEGPNISNVFKRTFYQMVYKLQLAGHRDCAGAAFMIPHSVWISWLRHLGDPTIVQRGDGTYYLGDTPDLDSASWILVFDLHESTDEGEPGRIKPSMEIQLSAERLIDLALRVSPAAALAPGGSVDGVKDSIQRRLGTKWRRALAQRNSWSGQ